MPPLVLLLRTRPIESLPDTAAVTTSGAQMVTEVATDLVTAGVAPTATAMAADTDIRLVTAGVAPTASIEIHCREA